MNSSHVPAISVVLPVFNNADVLSHALQSIQHQTFQNWECILINDGSTDASPEILSTFVASDARFHVITNASNQGLVKSLNTGILSSRGKWIARMDGDDWSHPDRLQLQYNKAESGAYSIVGANIWVCDNHLNTHHIRTYPQSDSEIRALWLARSPFCHAVCLFNKQALLSSGLYNSSLECAEDYDLYFRLSQHGPMTNLDTPLYKVRFHKSSISARRANRQLLITLYIRVKAIIEYQVPCTPKDILFLVLHGLSWFLPAAFRRTLWNYVRKTDLL